MRLLFYLFVLIAFVQLRLGMINPPEWLAHRHDNTHTVVSPEIKQSGLAGRMARRENESEKTEQEERFKERSENEKSWNGDKFHFAGKHNLLFGSLHQSPIVIVERIFLASLKESISAYLSHTSLIRIYLLVSFFRL